jgi:hypothetical protein
LHKDDGKTEGFGKETAMATTVAQMTREELREIIETIIEQKLLQLFGDRGVPADTLPQSSEPAILVDKDGVLVVRAEPLIDLANITQRARDLRLFSLIQQTGL